MKRKLIVVLLVFIGVSCYESSNKPNNNLPSNLDSTTDVLSKFDISKLKGEWRWSPKPSFPGETIDVEFPDFIEFRDSNYYYNAYSDDAIWFTDSSSILAGFVEKGDWTFDSTDNKVILKNRKFNTANMSFYGSRDSILNLYIKQLTDTFLEISVNDSKNKVLFQYEKTNKK